MSWQAASGVQRLFDLGYWRLATVGALLAPVVVFAPIGGALAESAGGNEATAAAMAELDLGEEYGCIVDAGRVLCWGLNEEGQLGTALDPNSGEPFTTLMAPVAGITNAIEVSSGTVHSCALLADGSVQCWGVNEVGQLGDGTLNNSAVPVTVSGITTAISVTAGGNHSCALLMDSSVQCWGENEFGQLGDGTENQSSTPVSVIGVSAESISAGFDHNCALAGGTISCWGFGRSSELDDGTIVPRTVIGISTATAVSAASNYTCAVLDDGAVQCWGINGAGQLGIRWREHRYG